MIVAGLGGSVHDFATAMATEDEILCAIEDERLTRVRHALGASDPLRPSWSYCIDSLGNRQPAQIVANDTLRHARLTKELKIDWRSHHLTHAASVFYTSPFENAAVLIVDGAGSLVDDLGMTHTREATSVYLGQGNKLSLRLSCPGTKNCPAVVNDFQHSTNNSLGDLYEWVTTEIGFQPLQEGKTMALATLGDDRFVKEFRSRCAVIGDFRVLVDIEGCDGLRAFVRRLRNGARELPFADCAALAFAAQVTLERLFVVVAQQAQHATGSKNLCVAGGVGLNAVLMGKLDKLVPFDAVHLISAPGDSGTAVGAALLPHAEGATEVKRWIWTPYLGKAHTVPYALLKDMDARQARDEEELLRWTLEELDRGAIVALFRGGSEFGPRALGHRSLVAWAAAEGILSRMNRLKGREWFRPIAPVTTVDSNPVNTGGERWMQMARPSANPQWPRAALHIDGSARVQLVDERLPDTLYYALAVRGDTPGVGPLLNTSFNINGEPIVETPHDALDAFLRSDIDVLILQDWLVRK